MVNAASPLRHVSLNPDTFAPDPLSLTPAPYPGGGNPPPSTRFQEDYSGGAGYGYSSSVDPDDHLYRRLTSSPRDLPPMLQERALRLAWALYEQNPLAHGIIEAMKDHIVSKGFSVRSADEKIQGVIDAHWNDWLNNWDLKQHDRVRDLSIFGEQLWSVYVNEANGHVRIASIDPSYIKNVFTNPDNPEDIQTIVINPVRKSSGLSKDDKFYRVIHEDENPASPTFGYLVGVEKDAQTGEPIPFTPPTGTTGRGSKSSFPYSGSCFFFTINRIGGALRGRTDLLSIIDWLDGYDQMMFNFIDSTLLKNCFVWDVTLEDANKAQIDDWRKNHARTPKPGTVNVHNQREKWEEVSPSLGSQELEIQQKTLKAQILSPTGMPPHWFGETEANRASAVEMGSPALKRLASRQIYIKYMFEYLIRFVIDSATIAGELKGYPKDKADREKEQKFEVFVPQMSSRDLSAASTSLFNVVNALIIALKAYIIDVSYARKIFVTIVQELGADIDLDSLVAVMDELGKLEVDPAEIDASNTEMSPGSNAGMGGNPKVATSKAVKEAMETLKDFMADPTGFLGEMHRQNEASKERNAVVVEVAV